MRLFYFGILLICQGQILPSERFHVLEFTSSDPKIKERCVELKKIEERQCGYVKETDDDRGRCIRLEFYQVGGKYFEAVDLPSQVTFVWTDSSLIETLLGSDGRLFSPVEMVRPNSVEYILHGNTVRKVKEFYDGNFVRVDPLTNVSIQEAVLSLMYSGCHVKVNKRHNWRF